MKKNELYTEKHGNLNLCGKETYPLAKISASFQNPKRKKKKTSPLVFLDIPIWRSYNPVLLDFFGKKKDIPNIKYNH